MAYNHPKKECFTMNFWVAMASIFKLCVTLV